MNSWERSREQQEKKIQLEKEGRGYILICTKIDRLRAKSMDPDINQPNSASITLHLVHLGNS